MFAYYVILLARLVSERLGGTLERRATHRYRCPSRRSGGRPDGWRPPALPARRVGVARELLHRGEVAYGVQQVAHEGLAEVVWGDLPYLRLPVAPLDHLVDGLVRERSLLLAAEIEVLDLSILPDGQEERLFRFALAPEPEPGGE